MYLGALARNVPRSYISITDPKSERDVRAEVTGGGKSRLNEMPATHETRFVGMSIMESGEYDANK